MSFPIAAAVPQLYGARRHGPLPGLRTTPVLSGIKSVDLSNVSESGKTWGRILPNNPDDLGGAF